MCNCKSPLAYRVKLQQLKTNLYMSHLLIWFNNNDAAEKINDEKKELVIGCPETESKIKTRTILYVQYKKITLLLHQTVTSDCEGTGTCQCLHPVSQ